MKIFLFAILLFWFVPAQAEPNQCIEKGKIRYRHSGKLITESASYCFNAEHNELISKNCRHGKKPCAALNQKKKKPLEAEGTQFGSPGFKSCYHYGARAQIIEFTDGKNWFPLDRCIFDEDKSFIDTGSFYILMK